MKKILVPTDLSDLGYYAYNIAYRISQNTGAEIHLLSILPAPVGAIFTPEGELLADEGIDLQGFDKERLQTKESLDAFAEKHPGIHSCNVLVGAVNEEILRVLREENFDLLVMGTHGASGFQELTIGSHAEYMVRNSPIPVISLKCDRSSYEINDLLFACEFNEKKKFDISALQELANAFKARIHFLKINTTSNFDTSRVIRENMIRFARMHEMDLSNIDMHIYCDETIEKGIQHFSEDTGIDFLVIATHQRKGFARIFTSSVSEDLVNHNNQPIMTFPIHA
jgi:nucleotide-binding universal stress UspA family protein